MSSVDAIAYPGQKTREEWLVEEGGLDHEHAPRNTVMWIIISSNLLFPFFPCLMYAPSHPPPPTIILI